MYVVAGFESNEYLEMAINRLIEDEVTEKDIIVVPLEPGKDKEENIFDSINRSDGTSLIDGITAYGMLGMLFGAIYGSQLYVGPVAIGLLGGILGCFIGYLLDKRRTTMDKRKRKINYFDFLLIIRCADEKQIKKVKSLCIKEKAVALGSHVLKSNINDK